jgi:hypothetical protein
MNLTKRKKVILFKGILEKKHSQVFFSESFEEGWNERLPHGINFLGRKEDRKMVSTLESQITVSTVAAHSDYRFLSATFLSLTQFMPVFKEPVSRDFQSSGFFHQSIPLWSLINGLNHFCILRINSEICKYK